MILMLLEYILRAQKHSRSLVHQHNMEMNIPLAVETNLWDSAPNTAAWDASQLSDTRQKVCPIAGEFAEAKVHISSEGQIIWEPSLDAQTF